MLLTGTTQGIGNHLYQRFYREYEITTVNRSYFHGENILCDLSDVEQTVDLCAKLKGMSFDVLINNAGGGTPMHFSDLTAKELLKCTNLNYHAPVLLMQAILEGMKERGYGRVVNISSIASKSPRALIPHYGAAKASLEVFSKSMARYYSDCGITINCVCPGGVQTDTSMKNRRIMAELSNMKIEYYNDAMVSGNGLGRMVEQNEVGDAVAFFISDSSKAVSGQTLNVCGIKEVHS